MQLLYKDWADGQGRYDSQEELIGILFGLNGVQFDEETMELAGTKGSHEF